jgi:hypothetical protein
VSCYAFFEWWLLLSQHPHRLRNFTSSFCTERRFRDLNWRSGLFPFCRVELRPHRLTAVLLTSGIRSLIEVAVFRPVRFFQCSTPRGNVRRKPESSFGENQLLPGSISFSLQPTSHPEILHNQWVRSSRVLSYTFNLLMGSSPGFGSHTYY